MKKLSILLFMVIVAISGCEKESMSIPFNELQPGDFYNDGIRTGWVVKNELPTPEDQSPPCTMTIIAESDTELIYGTDVYNYEVNGWRVPEDYEILSVSRTPNLWDGDHNFNDPDAYWCVDDGVVSFFQRDSNLTSGGPSIQPDDEEAHRLRLYQIIQFDDTGTNPI